MAKSITVVQEAVFIEDSTQPAGYLAQFILPADSLFQKLVSVNLSRWNDSGAPNLIWTFDRTNGPFQTMQNLTDAPGTPGGGGPTAPAPSPEQGAVYSTDRIVFVYVSGLSNDGSAGITQVYFYYQVPMSPTIAVTRG